MVQAVESKRSIKICCDGETKRLKISDCFAELVQRTRESFGRQQMRDQDFKFFYLDNEQEVISISSQADLSEALQDFPALKLVLASNMQEAVQSLYASMQDSMSIASSINRSQHMLGYDRMSSARSRALSDAAIQHQHQPAQPQVNQEPVANPFQAAAEPARGTLESLKAFQKQPVDCESSAMGSQHGNSEKQRGKDNDDQLHQTGVMVVRMGMKAAELHKAASANDDNQKFVTCPACNGSKVRGRKNKPCKTCQGHGQIPLSRFEGLFGIVKQELATYMENSMRDLMEKYQFKRHEDNPPQEEQKVANVANQPHQEPVQVPPQLQACCTIENQNPTLEVEPGRKFTQAWHFKNNGNCCWPVGVKLVVTEGDNIAEGIPQMAEVAQGSDCKLVAGFAVPEGAVGSFVSYLHIMTVDGQYFGPKVWCNINVKEVKQPEEDEKQDQPDEIAAEPLENPYQKFIPKAEDKRKQEPVPVEPEEPREPTYQELAQNHQYHEALMMLHEFGFTDFVVNEHLLNRHRNADVVANLMMSGQVTEEEIRAIYENAKQRQSQQK